MITSSLCASQGGVRRKTSARTPRCTPWARPSTVPVTSTMPGPWATGLTASCPTETGRTMSWDWKFLETSISVGRAIAIRPWHAMTRTTGWWKQHGATVTVSARAPTYVFIQFSSVSSNTAFQGALQNPKPDKARANMKENLSNKRVNSRVEGWDKWEGREEEKSKLIHTWMQGT